MRSEEYYKEKVEEDLFEYRLKDAERYILRLALHIEALIFSASIFLEESDILEEKDLFVVPGKEVPFKHFHIETKTKDENEWRLYVNLFRRNCSFESNAIIFNSISRKTDISFDIKFACFFPEGNITYIIKRGKFPDELMQFCRMKKVIPTGSTGLFDQMLDFFRGKLKLKMGWDLNTADNLLFCGYRNAQIMDKLIQEEEQAGLYKSAIQKFQSLADETAKALEATKSFAKSGRIASIRERLESQSAAIVAEINK